MKVTFYGKLASMIGRELEFVVDTPCTIGALRDQIAKGFPAAAKALSDKRTKACLGNNMVLEDHLLAPADEVEFLAPVSGG